MIDPGINPLFPRLKKTTDPGRFVCQAYTYKTIYTLDLLLHFDAFKYAVRVQLMFVQL